MNIEIGQKTELNERQGRIVQIGTPSLQEIESFLKNIVFKYQSFYLFDTDDKFDIFICIKDNQVSYFIGNKGKNINQIKQDSGCEISANIFNLVENMRPVVIYGNAKRVTKALLQAIKTLQEQG